MANALIRSRSHQLYTAATAETELANPVTIDLYNGRNISGLTPERIGELRRIYPEAYSKSLWSSADSELKVWYAGSEGRAWFDNAIDFYIGQARAGNADIVVAEHAKDGKVLGALFVLKGDAFISNLDPGLRSAFVEKLRKAGVSADKTLYGAEMFTSTTAGEFGGTRRAVMALMFDRYRECAATQPFTHDLIWTLDVRGNPLTAVARDLGFREVPNGRAEKGIDLGLREDGKLGYVVAREGPAIYLLCELHGLRRRSYGAGALR